MNANDTEANSDTNEAAPGSAAMGAVGDAGEAAGRTAAGGGPTKGDAGVDGDDLAVAGRMAALAGLGRPEDFVAIYAVLRTGRFTRDRLIELLRARDAGYDPFSFAGVLAELPHIPDEELAAGGLDDLEIAIMRACFADWYRALVSSGIP